MPGTVACTVLPDQGGFRIDIDWTGDAHPNANLKVERLVSGQPDVLVRPAYAPTVPTEVRDVAGMYLPGVPNAYASTPDSIFLDIVGDIDLRADVTLTDWTPTAASALIAKWNVPASLSYLFTLEADGTLMITWSANGTATTSIASTVPVPIIAGRLAVRVTLDVDNGAAGKTATFYTAPVLTGTWTQLGAPVTTAGTTSIFLGTSIGEIGTHTAGSTAPLNGIVHAVEIRNGIGGTAGANPDFAAQPSGTRSFVDPAGRTWTLNGLASIVGGVAGPGSSDFHVTNCGRLILWDYEAPMDVPVSYRVTDNPNGDIVTSTACVFPSGDSPWIKDPLRPCHNIKLADCRTECPSPDAVVFIGHEQEQYSSVSAQFEVIGKRRPIDISNIRRDAVTVIHFATLTCAARDAMLALTEPGTPVFMPAFDAICWPDRYLALGDHAVIPLSRDLRRTERLHTLPAVVVDAPAGATCCVTDTTWCEMCECADTWDEFDALALTGIQVLHGEAVAC